MISLNNFDYELFILAALRIPEQRETIRNWRPLSGYC